MLPAEAAGIARQSVLSGHNHAGLAAGITAGLLYRRVSISGSIGDEALSDKTVVWLIKRTARAVWHNEKRYSGHLLRCGFLTNAAMNCAVVP